MKISIITTCYNSEETIRETLKSIQQQEYHDLEYIVVDGHSSDATLDIIKDHDSMVDVLVCEQDSGIYEGMNKGLRLATGDIIGILNSDDTYQYENVLQDVAQTFESKGCDSIYGDLVYVDKNNEDVIRKWEAGEFYKSNFERGWMPPHPTFFVKREVYEKFGVFNEDLKISADYELMLRLLFKENITTAYIPKTLLRMRIGGRSNQLRNTYRVLKEDYQAWRVNGLEPKPYTIPVKKISKIKQYFS